MIRSYERGDHVAIAEIFSRAIHEIASRDYTAEQCAAWSERAPNPEHWEQRCERKRPFVYVVEDRVVGFCELDSDGHIDCTYVHPDYERRGIASELVSHVLAVAAARELDRVYVEASICARPMFEKLGFATVEEQTVSIRGVGLINFRMERACG
ncbi:MAG: GNAT family N-acetyltransferase [Verrucomicrobiota bacterium]